MNRDFTSFQKAWNDSQTNFFGRRIRVMDTTLREWAQWPGTGLTDKNKLLIATALADVWVDVLEIWHASAPADTPQNLQPIVRELNFKWAPILRMLARGMEKDIDWSAEVLKDVDVSRKEIHIYIPTDPNINHRMKGDSEQARKENTLEAIRKNITYAKNQWFESIQFSPEGWLTTPDFDFLCKSCIVAIESGATILNIPDTLWRLDPFEASKRFALLRQVLEPIMVQKGVIFSAHMHNDDGMANANTFGAVMASVWDMQKDAFHTQIETSLLWFGERNGIANIATLATRIWERNGIVWIQVWPLLYAVSSAAMRITWYNGNEQIATTWDTIFMNSAGVHHAGQVQAKKAEWSAGWYLNAWRIEAFGISPKETVFYQSGTTIIADILNRNGVNIDRTTPAWAEKLTKFMQEINAELLNAQWWKEWNIMRAWYEQAWNFSWHESNDSQTIGFSFSGYEYTIPAKEDSSHRLSYIGGMIVGINEFFEQQGIPWRMSEEMGYTVHDKETSADAAKQIVAHSSLVQKILWDGKLEGDIKWLGFCELNIELTHISTSEKKMIASRASGTNMQLATMRAMIEWAVLPLLSANASQK
jgi:isopropylmalate/homocitrate/citramalate synthase